MRPLVWVGVVLVVFGLVALTSQGITYTTKEKVVDLGPLKVETQKQRTIPLPPLVGVLAVVAGLLLVVLARR